MSDCKVKIKVDVCGESALDAVTRLVVDNAMPVKTACVQVAEEFNADNEGATVKWTTLKQSYVRANKTLSDMSHTKKSKTTIKIPVVDNTITIPIEEYNDLKTRVEELTQIICDYADKEVLEQQVKVGQLYRSVALEFISKRGNALQNMAIRTSNPTNKTIFTLLKGTRSHCLENAPPSSIPEDILNATEVINDTV